MFKRFLIAVISMFVILSCETMQPTEDKKTSDNISKTASEDKEGSITREEAPKMKATIYGADKEVQAVELDGKTYYVIGGKDIENMSEQEIKSSSLVAPLKITEETIKGNRGIVIVYYDIKIFLGKKGVTGTTVGIFEPQKNDWTFGDDIDRSQSIQVKISKGTAGPIDIKRASISLTYNY
ncbi:hypothetical protein [uncultured Brachyspira sp.]|uniref:hypothetical protein n=1 Tax=uncultured Brachyspira sp. TaxID=221953 RepID=UPI002619AFCC|nr:hypothetical protein [uncultured Brachyspira sp.]